MKTIELTKGKSATVDDIDYDTLSKYSWYTNICGYAVRNSYADGKHSTIIMHRVVMDATKGLEVDHINGDKLDNRRDNLRICTRSENQCNVGKRTHNTSGFKGVNWYPKYQKFRAYIGVNSKWKHLGYYTTAEEASAVYQSAAKLLHGTFARF